MSGIVLDQIKKNNEILRIQKTKSRSFLILSNLLTFVLTWVLLDQKSNNIIPPTKMNRNLHRDHQVVVVPLKMMAEISRDQSEIPLTLINSKNQIVVRKVYLIEQIENSKSMEDKNDLFKIEIPESEILKIKAGGQDNMIAIPEIKKYTDQIILPKRSQSKYEINL